MRNRYSNPTTPYLAHARTDAFRAAVEAAGGRFRINASGTVEIDYPAEIEALIDHTIAKFEHGSTHA